MVEGSSMAVGLDLASYQFDDAILDTSEGVGKRRIPCSQALYLAAFKSNTRLHPLKQFVLKRRPLVRDAAPPRSWTLGCHEPRMLSDGPFAATAFSSNAYNQVAV